MSKSLLLLLAVAVPSSARAADVKKLAAEFRRTGGEAERDAVLDAARKSRLPSTPEEGLRHMARGAAAYRAGSFEDAAKEFSQAADAAPWWDDAYFNLGLAQDRLGRYDEAIRSFGQFVRASRDEAAIRTGRMMIYESEYRREKGLTPEAALITPEMPSVLTPRSVSRAVTASPDPIEGAEKHPAASASAPPPPPRAPRYVKPCGLGLCTFDVLGAEVIHGFVLKDAPEGSDAKAGSWSEKWRAPLRGRDFSWKDKSWCDEGFKCPGRGQLSEDGQTVTVRFMDHPMASDAEVSEVYRRE